MKAKYLIEELQRLSPEADVTIEAIVKGEIYELAVESVKTIPTPAIVAS